MSVKVTFLIKIFICLNLSSNFHWRKLNFPGSNGQLPFSKQLSALCFVHACGWDGNKYIQIILGANVIHLCTINSLFAQSFAQRSGSTPNLVQDQSQFLILILLFDQLYTHKKGQYNKKGIPFKSFPPKKRTELSQRCCPFVIKEWSEKNINYLSINYPLMQHNLSPALPNCAWMFYRQIFI